MGCYYKRHIATVFIVMKTLKIGRPVPDSFGVLGQTANILNLYFTFYISLIPNPVVSPPHANLWYVIYLSWLKWGWAKKILFMCLAIKSYPT